MKSQNNKKIENCIHNFSKIIQIEKENIEKLKKISMILERYNKKRNNVHIFGNGGSATIASHFSMDLTNNTSIRCFNYNDPSLITCYSNDFSYENWISRTILKYGDYNDLLILISSSGNSRNMINAYKAAKKKKFYKTVSFTGFEKQNKLGKLTDINFWINSKNYNSVESAHNFFLLMLVDLLKK
jgi:D-sedoheptulose 7-phosphate isomerase